MDRHTQRIERLIELRQRQVDVEVSHLSAAQRDVMAALEDVNQTRLSLEAALQQRRQMSRVDLDVRAWMDLEDWCETLAVRHSLAGHRLATARAHERRASARVGLAYKKRKQAELLMDRLLREQRGKQARAQRRDDDEIAQRSAYRRNTGHH